MKIGKVISLTEDDLREGSKLKSLEALCIKDFSIPIKEEFSADAIIFNYYDENGFIVKILKNRLGSKV